MQHITDTHQETAWNRLCIQYLSSRMFLIIMAGIKSNMSPRWTSYNPNLQMLSHGRLVKHHCSFLELSHCIVGNRYIDILAGLLQKYILPPAKKIGIFHIGKNIWHLFFFTVRTRLLRNPCTLINSWATWTTKNKALHVNACSLFLFC